MMITIEIKTRSQSTCGSVLRLSFMSADGKHF